MKNKLTIKLILGAGVLLIILLLINFIIIKKASFILNGNSKIYLYMTDTWDDPGYKVDDKYINNVTTNSNLNMQNEGSKTITYTLKIGLLSKKLKREIVILSNDKKSDLYFELNKDNPYYLMKNNIYQEYGAMAIDNNDGDISKNIIIDNSNLNNSIDGTYYVKYQITTKNGIKREIDRKVIVYSFNFEGKLKTDDYSQNNEIFLAINDFNYNYVILPNQEKTTDRIINYQIKENGNYIFKIYDKKNSVYEYVVNVNNIDNEKPTGTCTLSLNNSGASINVNASDNHEIKGYQYHYGSTNTELIKDSNYTISTNDEKATVTIYDSADNSIDINCNTIDKSSKYTRSYTIESINYNGKKRDFWLYKPEHSAREKMPLLVYLHGDGGRKDIKSVTNYAFPKFIKDGMDFPFYMIAPYCNNESDFSLSGKMQEVIQIIEYVKNNYNIDADRIIISGGSSGGKGAYTMAAIYQNTFSCLVVGSGVIYTVGDLVNNLTYLPIWIFHGKNDKLISLSGVQNIANRIKIAGGNVKLSEIDGGHEITETVFKSPELIEWMISQRKSNQKK